MTDWDGNPPKRTRTGTSNRPVVCPGFVDTVIPAERGTIRNRINKQCLWMGAGDGLGNWPLTF